MAKTLLVYRHAKSDWGDSSLEDYDRPLNSRGRMAAPLMGRFFAEQQIFPDLVLCSTAARAQQTLLLTMESLLEARCDAGIEKPKDWPCAVKYDRGLYLSSPDEILSILRLQDDSASSILVIAHNPGLQKLIARLCESAEDGLEKKLAEKFPTAALASIALPAERWKDLRFGSGTLQRLVYPREIQSTPQTGTANPEGNAGSAEPATLV